MSLLEVSELQKSYRLPNEAGSRLVVDVPRFTLDNREELAVRGASGSGKTTFLHLIAGILAADSGRVLVDGEEMTALSEAARDRLRARSIGYVFQTFQLLEGYTAFENVMLAMRFGVGADAGRARELLSRVGLGDRLSSRPTQMSTGQQQRVAVARALANRPRLVLADEPTGNLDPSSSAAALELLREVCAECDAALLLVTHDRDVLARFERVADFGELNRALAEAGEAAS